MVTVFVIWPVVALVAAVIADQLARRKNRHRPFWMTFAFLIPPAAILLYFLKKLPDSRKPKYDTDDDDLRDFLRP